MEKYVFAVGLVAGLVSLSGCTSLGGREAKTNYHSVSDVTSCFNAGGKWGNWQDSLEESCNLPTGEGDKSCSNSRDCIGVCVPNGENGQGGHCSEFEKTHACFSTYEDGKVFSLCIN